MRICVYGASSDQIDPVYLAAGEALGEEMARRGHTLVFGGGANGMMGAVARGMTRGGGEIIGIAPTFFNVDGILYDRCTTFHYTETMRERKALMEELSDCFLMTPGGIGTLEEFFEILTLRQLGRHNKPIGVLDTAGYYQPMEAMLQQMVEQRFLLEACRELYAISTDPAALLDAMEQPQAQIEQKKLKNI